MRASIDSGLDAVRRGEILNRLKALRAEISDRLDSEIDGPLAQRCRAHAFEALGVVETSPSAFSNNPGDLHRRYLVARLFALEQIGSEPDALIAELGRGRRFLAERLALQQQKLTGSSMNSDRFGEDLIEALDRIREVVNRLAALDVTLPPDVRNVGRKSKERLREVAVDDHAAHREITQHLAAEIETALIALTSAPPCRAKPADNVPRLPLDDDWRRWSEAPALPDAPMTWHQLRPFVLAHAEKMMEERNACGPELLDNYLVRLKWVFDHVGPIAAEIADRPFDLSGIRST